MTAISQTIVRGLPPGATPPFIIQYIDSNLPVVQIALQSDTLSEQQLFDLGINFVRADIATVPGTQQIPLSVRWSHAPDHDRHRPGASLRLGAFPARRKQRPVGLQKTHPSHRHGTHTGVDEFPVVTNSSPVLIEQLGSLAVEVVNGTTVYMRDIGNVRDGYAPQQSIVHVNGRKSVLMTILKHGSASTLDVVARIRETMPSTLARLTHELHASLMFDQSLFVRAAVDGVVKEAGIAAALTALMLLLFLGSWRSTLIVIVSIPLSILVSIIVLAFLGQTLNVMTLGGMALAVGILVDDATVEIENVHRNFAMRKPIVKAILDGAAEIAVPAFVSTLCICIVFVPVVFISGSAKSLFVPLAMAVVFAMLTSYFLSRTLVPTLMRYLLGREAAQHAGHVVAEGIGARLHARFNRAFDRLRHAYGSWLALVLGNRAAFVAVFLGFVVATSAVLFPLIGRDFFPSVDAGLIKLHVRGPPGTRIEETERHFAQIEDTIRTVIPSHEIETLLDNIGTPASGLNMSLSEGALISSADGQIMIALKEHQCADSRTMSAVSGRCCVGHIPKTLSPFSGP